jgi:hypothetical protein
MQAMYRERDEPTRQKMVREMTRDILDKAPYIWLPVAYTYAAWWPWVKNYDGEIYGGGFWWAAGPCAHLDRSGPEEEDGVLITVGMVARPSRSSARGR